MSTVKVFHHLSSQTMHPLDMKKEEYEEARHTWLCTDCCEPKPGIRGLDVTVDNEQPGNAALNFVMGCGIPTARKEFLFSLGEELVSRNLYLGRVFGPDRKPLDELVTFRGKRRLLVRGVKRAGYRICRTCGREVYFSMIGSRYLYPMPPSGTDIFESHLWGLILPDGLFKKIDLSKWKEVTHEQLTVALSPNDGFLRLKALEDREEDQ